MPPSAGDEEQLALLAGLIAGIGHPRFGASLFAYLQARVGACHVVASLVNPAGIRTFFTEGRLAPRIAAALNERYLERYHLLDPSLRQAWRAGRTAPVAVRFDNRRNVSDAYTAFFFERAGLCDKISLISIEGDAMVICGLYRLATAGRFDSDDEKTAKTLALPVTAALWQHASRVAAAPPQPVVCSDGRSTALRLLSPRELEVCQRLLAGASNEGVALDLALSTHTVRTLRKRIYRKLEVGSLSDLFSKYLLPMAAFARGPDEAARPGPSPSTSTPYTHPAHSANLPGQAPSS
jgi:DNA-binding CsgD family transcriptional regulator